MAVKIYDLEEEREIVKKCPKDVNNIIIKSNALSFRVAMVHCTKIVTLIINN